MKKGRRLRKSGVPEASWRAKRRYLHKRAERPLKQSEAPIPFLRNIGKGGGSQAASINGFSAKNSRCFGEDKDIDFY